jgi:hypothetical protein
MRWLEDVKKYAAPNIVQILVGMLYLTRGAVLQSPLASRNCGGRINLFLLSPKM